MVKGILADIHVKGPVENLVRAMQTEPWDEFWRELGVRLFLFENVGLTPTSTDREIWLRCQVEQLILITNNRNEDSPDSLETTIRQLNTSASLPVFTIANLDALRKNRDYAERVLERAFDYLLRIDDVRGTGRLFLP